MFEGRQLWKVARSAYFRHRLRYLRLVPDLWSFDAASIGNGVQSVFYRQLLPLSDAVAGFGGVV